MRDLRVAFSLAGRDPAFLELFDLAGRRVASARVEHLGPGRHVLPIARVSDLGPGLYFLRLTQGAASRTAKVTVLR